MMGMKLPAAVVEGRPPPWIIARPVPAVIGIDPVTVLRTSLMASSLSACAQAKPAHTATIAVQTYRVVFLVQISRGVRQDGGGSRYRRMAQGRFLFGLTLHGKVVEYTHR